MQFVDVGRHSRQRDDDRRICFRGLHLSCDLTQSNSDFSVHGGGDLLLYRDFCEYLERGGESVTRTTLRDSLMSHYMCFMAEKSRLAGGAPQKVGF